MKWYNKALIGAGLLGLSSLGGCKNESVEPVDLELSKDGTEVNGKINGIDVSYFIRGNEEVSLRLRKDGISKAVTIDDGGHGYAIDGNINYFYMQGLGGFFYNDNGDKTVRSFMAEEEVQRLRNWGNEKLKEVHTICKEKFGDKLKIPYKVGKRSLDEVLKDFDL